MIEENDTVGDLHDRLMTLGSELVMKTVDAIANQEVEPIDQSRMTDHPDKIKQAPKIFKEDCRIDWTKDTESVRNLVRGLSPYPTAWTEFIHSETNEILMAKIFSVFRDNRKSPSCSRELW